MESSIQEEGPRKDPDASSGIGPAVSRRIKLRIFLPLMGFCFCFQFGVLGWTVLQPQYILDRLRRTSENVTITTDICNVNGSDPFYLAEKKLERHASMIASISSLCSGVPAVFTVLLYSSLSDRFGRKVTLTIPYVGSSLVLVFIACWVAFDLPFWALFIARFALGLSGSSMAVLAGLFASAADVTTPERRSIALAIIQACNGLAMLFANLITGFWVRKVGFVPPTIFLSSLMVASGLLLFFIRETWPRHRRLASAPEHGRVRALTNQLQHMKTTLWRQAGRRRKIFVLVSSFTLNDLSHTSLVATLTLYVMGQPFCWGSAVIGTFNAFKVAIIMVGGSVGIFVLRRCLSDVTLSLMGTVSHIAFQFLLGFSSFFQSKMHNVVIGVAVISGLVAAVPSITLRGLSSSLVSSDEQGAIFGLLAIGDVLSTSFGPVLMNGIYAATVTSMPFFVFYMCAGLLSVSLLLLIIYKAFLNAGGDSELQPILT